MKRNNFVCAVLGAALVFCARAVGAAGAFVETQTITLANPARYEDLGFSLDVSGGLAITGAIGGTNAANQGTGAAYIYRQANDGQWNQVAKLLPSDGQANDYFGYDVGIDGDWAIVNAGFHGESSSSSQYGATYFFHRNSDNNWQQASEFLAPARTTSYFSTVSISGGQAVVSGDYTTTFNREHGVADVLTQTGPSSWASTQRIEIPGQGSRIYDTAIQNGTLAIGGARTDTSGGPTTYFVEMYEDSPTGFISSASILPPVPSVAFGSAVSLDHDRMLIGASGEAGHGAAYVYEREANDTWAQVAHLVPSDIDQRFLIGTEVELHGDLAFVNSWDSPNGLGDGRIYVFQRDNLGNWLEIQKLTSPLAQATFGHSLAGTDGQILVGSGVNFPGAVHVFSQVPEPTAGWFLAAVVIVAANIRLGRKSIVLRPR